MRDHAKRHTLVQVLAQNRPRLRLATRANFGAPLAPPRIVVVQYAHAINSLLAPVFAVIDGAIRKWVPAILAVAPMRRDARADSPTADLIVRAMGDIQVNVGRVLHEGAIQQTAAQAAGNVSAQNAAQIRKQMSRVLGLDIPIADTSVRDQLGLFTRNNTNLIRTLVDRHVAKVRTIVEVQAARGANVDDIRDQIMAATDATKAGATLIARDQVLKLNGQITELRHKEIGINKYKWSGSLDARERDDHRALEGKIFSYSDPPITNQRTGERNNPGGDIQCRCVALPDLTDLLAGVEDPGEETAPT